MGGLLLGRLDKRRTIVHAPGERFAHSHLLSDQDGPPVSLVNAADDPGALRDAPDHPEYRTDGNLYRSEADAGLGTHCTLEEPSHVLYLDGGVDRAVDAGRGPDGALFVDGAIELVEATQFEHEEGGQSAGRRPPLVALDRLVLAIGGLAGGTLAPPIIDERLDDDPVVLHVEIDGQHAAAGLDRQSRLAGNAVVVHVLRHAAQPVAAHLGLGAVGVEHPHPGVGQLRLADEDEPVGADAEVPIADGAGECRQVGGHGVADAIDVHVIVADPVHLGEPHGARLDEKQERTGF